jgi:hypothetical protein
MSETRHCPDCREVSEETRQRVRVCTDHYYPPGPKQEPEERIRLPLEIHETGEGIKTYMLMHERTDRGHAADWYTYAECYSEGTAKEIVRALTGLEDLAQRMEARAAESSAAWLEARERGDACKPGDKLDGYAEAYADCARMVREHGRTR